VAEKRFERALTAAGPLPIVALLFAIAAGFVFMGRAFHQTQGSLAATLADLKPVHAGVSVGGESVQWLRRVALGDKLVTDADGRARLRLDDGTGAVLDRSTVLVITEKGFRLEQGRAHLTSPTGSHPAIELGGMTVLLSGGSAGLELRGDKTSVFSADSELTVRGPDGKEAHVNAGETARLAQGAVKVAPERAYDDWTHGLARPWAARGSPRRSVGELWGSVEGGTEPAGSAGSPLTIRSHTVNARIDRELSHTTCETVFFNAGSSNVSGDFRIALPPGALVSGFAVERGGSRQDAQIALAARSRQELASGGGVLEWAGDGWLRGTLPGIASGEELKVEVKYVEWLSPRRHGEGELVQYRYPLVGDGEAPLIGDFVARIDASPSAPTGVAAGYGATSDSGIVTVHRSDFRPSADLVVDIESHRSQNRARLYVAPPAWGNQEAGSAVMLRAELPPADVNDGVTLAIVMDTSGSIEPALLDAERALVDALLSGLGARDRAVVLSADQGTRPVGPEKLGPVDDARRKAISTALGKLSPGGATDLGRALEAAADLLPTDAPAGMVVYVGDGWATLGDSNPEAISARLSRREAGAPRLGAIAVGPLANRRVLSALTRGSGPLYEIADSEDASRVAVELMSDALRPALASVEVDLGAEVDQVYPRTPRAIAAGETLTAVGRIRGEAPKFVMIRYRDARGAHEEKRALDVLRADDADEVRRRWASERVEEIVLTGKGREAATDVALKAGLVTPWTALRIGGSGEYIARAFETRVLDLSSDGASVVGPVLATAGDLTGTLSAFDDESASAQSIGEALEQAAGRILDGAAASVRACRDSRAALRPELSGALDVAFAIDGDGLPHDVVVKGSTPSADDEALNRCVKLVIEGLRFPSGATGPVKVARLIQLPPAPQSLGPRHCSDVSRLPMPLRRGAWWTRLTQNEASSVYVQAKRQCELSTWTDRRALLELMLLYQADGVARVDLAARLALLGEPDAASLLRREAVRRVRSPEELSNVRRALLGSERYPGSLFEDRYKAAANDQDRLAVVRRFLELAPHDSRLRRRHLALLEALNRPAEVLELSRELRSDPFADALLLADAASALHRTGADLEAHRTFGELSERAPKDPWVRGLLGDRLRSEGWFDEATEAYATLEELVPDDARATLRSALAHAGAGRLDIAERLLTRVARTGGRGQSGELGELSRQLGRILAESALSSSSHKPSTEEGSRLRRLAADLAQAEASTIVLVQAEAGAPELKVRLAGAGSDKSLHEPDVAAPSLGLYLFRTSASDAPQRLVERLSIASPSELLPAHPVRVRVDALPPNSAGALFTRELTLPSDGKALALAP
jgi:von Willebrand factor type A domain/Vault protein inter-alpha-trypsin domain